jgi:flagellar FliL protein
LTGTSLAESGVDMSDAKDKADAPAAAPKKKSKLVLILALAFVVLGGGGAGAFWYFKRPPADGKADEAKEEKAEAAVPPGIVELEPFVVNLADPGGQRYVRVSLRLLTHDEEQALEIKESAVANAKLRSSILELLSMQTADGLVTPDGKNALKKAIAEQASHAVHELKVTDVLFVEFIVQ